MTETEWLACIQPQLMLDYLQGKISDRKLRLFAVACCRQVWHLLPNDHCRKAVQVAERFADGLARRKELLAVFETVWPAVERRLRDRVDEQGSLPMAREYAGLAVAATAAVGRGRITWLDAWSALREDEGLRCHRNPWDLAADATSAASAEEREFNIHLAAKDASSDVDAWTRAWERGDAKACQQLERRKALHLEEFVRLEKMGIEGIEAITRASKKVNRRMRSTGGTPRYKSHIKDMEKGYIEAHSRQCVFLRDIVGTPFRVARFQASSLKWSDGCIVKIALGIYAERRFEAMPILADALEEAGCDNPDILQHCRSDGPHVRGCWVLDLLLGKE